MVKPEICAPAKDCCVDGMTDEEFQNCLSDKGGDVLPPTSFLEMHAEPEVFDAYLMSMSMDMGVPEEEDFGTMMQGTGVASGVPDEPVVEPVIAKVVTSDCAR
jgi:hypothetical protein